MLNPMGQIQPEAVKREIEAAIGSPCAFRWSVRFDRERQAERIEMTFAAAGAGAGCDLLDADLALSMEEFRTRIIEPMVAIWRARKENDNGAKKS